KRKQKVLKPCKQIFKHGASINGIHIKEILAIESLVPTINAFSECIQAEDEAFNFFCLFVVDLLHEFELEVWKVVFINLMRILYAVGGMAMQQLNFRYGRVPTFGRGTIGWFHKNTSAMKHLTAWDFEDLLQ
ncbi:hypothetical protein BS17DRAFT_665724, partial [Gyrodon lividus]